MIPHDHPYATRRTVGHTVTRMMRRWLAQFGMSLCLIAPVLGAQTRFAIPDTTPDFSRYRSPEQCLAAGKRLGLEATRALPYWPDSMPVLRREALDSLPASVREIVRRCMNKFNPDSASTNLLAYDLWMELYLMAGQDEIASSIAERRLVTTEWNASDSTQNRNEILEAIADLYGRVRPLRLAQINALASYFTGPDRPSNIEHLLTGYGWLFDYNRNAGDTAVTQSIATEIVTLSATMTEEQKSTEYYRNGRRSGSQIVMGALDFLSRNTQLDSLRKSSASYLAVKRANWEKARSPGSGKMPSVVGETAPPLTGEFIFAPSGERLHAAVGGPGSSTGSSTSSSTGVTVSRPTRGKVSIVVFLYGGCRAETPSSPGKVRPSFSEECQAAYIIMHRLARQFPEVEITIASRTTGYVGDTRPLTPAEEADVLQSWWLGYHRLPATLIIANTQFFRLEKYDRRRIDVPVDNTTQYLFGNERARELPNKHAFVIDVDGTVLEAGILNRGNEQRFREVLEIITKRPK